MRPRVWFSTADEELAELSVGDLIGRMPTCALSLNDPRVSEAHALVSLRGDALKLLALRGRLEVRNRSLSEVTLRPGVVIALAPGVALTVEAVELPDELPALRFPDGTTHTLLGTTSVTADDPPRVVSGWAADAALWLWPRGEGWYVRTAAGATLPLPRVGDPMAAGAHTIRVASVPLNAGEQGATLLDGHRSALHLTLRFHAAILRAGDRTLQLDGIPARLICEVAAMGGPTEWETVAREIWSDAVHVDALRRRWDVNLARVRQRLREAGFRGDLLRSDRSGCIALALGPDDVIVDEM